MAEPFAFDRTALLLIEKGEPHQIINTGAPLVTINFYSPPAYRKNGELLRSNEGVEIKSWRPVGRTGRQQGVPFRDARGLTGLEQSASANAKPQGARNARVVDRRAIRTCPREASGLQLRIQIVPAAR
jgi:hypothetical protein